MLWTVAVIADSAQTFYELFVRRLSAAERESLWQDYLRFGELFGMPAETAPAAYLEFRRYWEGRLRSPEAHLTAEARRTGAAIMFEIPVPAIRRPAMKLHNLIMLGSLPAPVRRLYGLDWSPLHAAAFRAAVAGLRAPRPLTPARLRSGRNDSFFDVVAETERSLYARGEPIPGALA